MRVAVLSYPGVPRACYQQLIGAALRLAQTRRMQKMARWDWTRFSGWLHALPFEMDTGGKGQPTATACSPPQRMRAFPPTMNCWERVLHQLAWFAARGAARVTVYDHDTLIGRHIEVLVPAGTNLSEVANAPADQALAGILAGLQGGAQGGMVGSTAGPYGALAGLLLGAAAGVAKSVIGGESKGAEAKPLGSPPAAESTPSKAAPPHDAPPGKDTKSTGVPPIQAAPLRGTREPLPSIQDALKQRLQRPRKAKSVKRRKRRTP